MEKNIEKIKLNYAIRSELNVNRENNSGLNSTLNSAYCRLLSINNRLSNNHLFKEGYDNMKKLSQRKKILIVTATLTELRILLKVTDDKGIERSRFTSGKHTYFVLSQLGKNDVYIFRTEMGSVGSTGSILSINDAISTINPDYVIMAGIAFGLKKSKQNLGDILVSRQLWSSEQAKITDVGRISRGDKITASGLLLDRFSTSSLDWKKTKVDFGLIVSGEKLVNSKQLIKELLESEPEAIGGEMEGTGLMSVCQSVQKEWILIKSICDWGYKKSSQYQETAASNVMEFVIDTIANYFD
jgi:nucleoside phosphorylase